MKPTFAALALAATLLASGSAFADGRKPNPEELTAIEGALKAAGFTTWKKVELDDDGYWDVDDAIHADGKQYDVDLAVADLKIIKQEVDTD
jgi:hypothetical protein